MSSAAGDTRRDTGDGCSQVDALVAKESSGVQRLVYVSCGWKALQRDTMVLVSSGGWRVAHAEAIQFFPGTDSMETLCVFDRVHPQPNDP